MDGVIVLVIAVAFANAVIFAVAWTESQALRRRIEKLEHAERQQRHELSVTADAPETLLYGLTAAQRAEAAYRVAVQAGLRPPLDR